MSFRFAASTETQMQVCRKTIKQLRRNLPFDAIVSEGKRNYRISKVNGNYDKSKMLDATTGIKKVSIRSGRNFYKNGLWYVQVYKQGDRFSTFDIGVMIPCENASYDATYNPTTIKKEITRQFGADFYEEWRCFAISRIDNLKDLIAFVRDDIKSIHSSVWCCNKSKYLLKRVGLPIIGDWTFLTPSRYQ